ncbi:hypothetical protein BDZ45DRAFT_734646 [Acephala macrosclerotiorum]|nr:hypothetical protein BDZ45DRAFT_734646 [Acephala macrosclerotiorum]
MNPTSHFISTSPQVPDLRLSFAPNAITPHHTANVKISYTRIAIPLFLSVAAVLPKLTPSQPQLQKSYEQPPHKRVPHATTALLPLGFQTSRTERDLINGCGASQSAILAVGATSQVYYTAEDKLIDAGAKELRIVLPYYHITTSHPITLPLKESVCVAAELTITFLSTAEPYTLLSAAERQSHTAVTQSHEAALNI